MNKIIKKILLASLCFSALVPCVFASPAISKSDREIAADVQREIMNSYSSKTTKQKIKTIKKQISENESYIKNLEKSKAHLEAKVYEKRVKCERLSDEINECPYYNCRQCIELSYKINRLQNSIQSLESDIENKEYKLEIAKDKRTKLDGDLAILLQKQELENF